MHFLSLKNYKLWLDSINKSIYLFGLIATIMTIIDLSFSDFFPNTAWVYRLIYLMIIFVIFVIIINVIEIMFINHSLSVKIHGITVRIKQGDIFKTKGKKIIPCNEYFDTTVNEKIISKETLQGIFISKYVKDISCLKQCIENDEEDNIELKKYMKNNRTTYPLGRIIPYNDYLLLSFAEFNVQNEAHLTKSKYENCLINTWKEICRTYTHCPVNVPLLGSGITRIDDWLDRTNFDLLKCMLNTLFMSRVDIRKPITVILTKEVMKNINIYELKGGKYL
jgi:hypothetical protein